MPTGSKHSLCQDLRSSARDLQPEHPGVCREPRHAGVPAGFPDSDAPAGGIPEGVRPGLVQPPETSPVNRTDSRSPGRRIASMTAGDGSVTNPPLPGTRREGRVTGPTLTTAHCRGGTPPAPFPAL
jgi:hypothetical protein